MKTTSLSRTPCGGWAVSSEDESGDPDGDQARPPFPDATAGEGTLMASSPQRAVVIADGRIVYRGPADIAAFYFGRWSAEHPEKTIVIEPEGDA